MKITEIKSHLISAGYRDWLLVKVETDTGISGWGESTIIGYNRTVQAAIEDLIGNSLNGKDPRTVEVHSHFLYRDSWFRPSLIFQSAIAGVEMALWDIRAKDLGVPVYSLFGGGFQTRIPVYDNIWYFSAKSLDDYGRLAQIAVEKGAKRLKWDPFWGADTYVSPAEFKWAKDCVRTVREAVGDGIDLLIEMHGRFSPQDAIRLIQELDEFHPFWYEEPIVSNCNYEYLKSVADATTVRIATGEKVYTRWQFWELLKVGAVSVIQPDMTWCGGFAETKKIADMAQVHYVTVAPHSASGPFLIAANMHLDACIPNFLVQEFFSSDVPTYQEILVDPFLVAEEGYVQIPDKPGWGLEVNEKALATRPFVPQPHPLHGGHYKTLEEYVDRQ